MQASESVYHPARHADDPFVRAFAAGRKQHTGRAVASLNGLLAAALSRTSGGGAGARQIRAVLEGLLAFGFAPADVLAMLRRFPNLLCFNWAHFHGTRTSPGLLPRLEHHGFTRADIVRMATRLPMLFSYSWRRTCGDEAAPGTLLNFERYGFSRAGVIRMCTGMPAILSYSWRHTHGTASEPGVLLRLEAYGFTRAQVVGLCERAPGILGYSWDRTHGTPDQPGILLRLEGTGLSREEVIALCERLPVLLCCCWERTARQLALAGRIGLLLLFPQIIMFSPEKAAWRWDFLTRREGLDAAHARPALFLSRDLFHQRFRCDYAPPATAAGASRGEKPDPSVTSDA